MTQNIAAEGAMREIDRLTRERDELRAKVAELEAERQKITAFMDSVRDAARNRNPEGFTVLDFMACWNEQYERRIAELEAALATPEVYAGVVSEVLERERDAALAEVARLRDEEIAREKFRVQLLEKQAATGKLIDTLEQQVVGLAPKLDALLAERDAAVREVERRREYDERAPDPRRFKYLNPQCMFDGCQTLVLQGEIDKLRAAIKRAGFSVMETSGEWSIHDVSEHGKAEEQRTADVVSRNIDLEQKVARLRTVIGIQDGETLVEAGDGWYVADTRGGQRRKVTMMADELRELERLRREIQAAGNLNFDWSVLERLDRLEELESVAAANVSLACRVEKLERLIGMQPHETLEAAEERMRLQGDCFVRLEQENERLEKLLRESVWLIQQHCPVSGQVLVQKIKAELRGDGT